MEVLLVLGDDVLEDLLEMGYVTVSECSSPRNWYSASLVCPHPVPDTGVNEFIVYDVVLPLRYRGKERDVGVEARVEE